jgi:hypothetical protein
MADSLAIIVEELRTIALLSTEDLEIDHVDTIEWDAARRLEVAARALREIRDGGREPKGIARIALMSVQDEIL